MQYPRAITVRYLFVYLLAFVLPSLGAISTIRRELFTPCMARAVKKPASHLVMRVCFAWNRDESFTSLHGQNLHPG